MSFLGFDLPMKTVSSFKAFLVEVADTPEDAQSQVLDLPPETEMVP